MTPDEAAQIAYAAAVLGSATLLGFGAYVAGWRGVAVSTVPVLLGWAVTLLIIG